MGNSEKNLKKKVSVSKKKSVPLKPNFGLTPVWLGRKMAIFADVHYHIYAKTVGGSEKLQKYADVI